MKKNFEEILYEKLGVKIFKKLVILLQNIIRKPFNKKNAKLDFDNYYLTSYNLNGLQKYKKQGIIVNSIIHIPFLIISIMLVITSLITCNYTLKILLTQISLVLINGYCVMLQRYNQIRINKLITSINKRNIKKQSEEYKEIVKSIENSKSFNKDFVEELKTSNQNDVNMSYLRLLRNESSDNDNIIVKQKVKSYRK